MRLASRDPRVSTRPTWLLTGGVLAVDVAWMAWGGWSVPLEGLTRILAAVAGLLAVLSIGRYRRDTRIRNTLLAVILTIVFTASAGVLSYLIVSTNAPLVDPVLAALDRGLGFDWLAMNDWLRERSEVAFVLRCAYFSGLPQMAFVLLFLGLAGYHATLHEFLRLLARVTVTTVILSGFFPAEGAWKYYGVAVGYDLASLSHFEPLRTGMTREIALGSMQGLISIPSLHAATAVLLVYAVRVSSTLLPIFVLLNVMMLIATPADGSHYLVDVIAGLVLAFVWVAIDRRRAEQPGRSRMPDVRLGVWQR